MQRTVLNSALLVVVAALVSANWILRASPAQRNFELFPDMARSVPYDAFAANPNFRDGKTLREPVPGTVIRGFAPLNYAPTPAGAQRAGRELVNPVHDVRALQRGAAVYGTYCEICHGPAGKGDGTVAKRGFPAPPSLLAPKARALADGQLFHILTFGQNNMPSYAAQVDRADRWKAVLYVRELQRRSR